MITRSSIDFKDLLASSIAPQVTPPCHPATNCWAHIKKCIGEFFYQSCGQGLVLDGKLNLKLFDQLYWIITFAYVAVAHSIFPLPQLIAGTFPAESRFQTNWCCVMSSKYSPAGEEGSACSATLREIQSSRKKFSASGFFCLSCPRWLCSSLGISITR